MATMEALRHAATSTTSVVFVSSDTHIGPLVEEQPEPATAPAVANHRYGLVSGGASAKLYSDIQTSDAPRISQALRCGRIH